MKKLLIFAAATAVTMTGCNSSQKKQEADADAAPKVLVLYYSQSGTTEGVAQEIQKALGADIELIEMEEPYSGTYDETIQRCLGEMQSGTVPAIKPIKANIADYDVVFLGYPIWFGTYATPIKGLLSVQDFAGKKVVPFCTFGSGGLETSAADLAAALPQAQIAEGYGVRTARKEAAPAELQRFLIEQGYLEGEIEPLPEFSEEAPVTPDEEIIFNQACGSYQFPLGTPVAASSRTVGDVTEYRYIAESPGMDGTTQRTTIYVLAAQDAEPVFTRVVR